MFYFRTLTVLGKEYALHVPKVFNGKNIVGRRVAEARNLSRPPITQDALSGRLARLGIHLDRAAIAKIENGHRGVLDYELKAFATALGVQVNWLLGDER
ncbi:MAG: helix-turn-helix transcriptional regulator [Bryobacteraceae bacterium]